MRIKLQFARIGVNLLGSFLTEFRNSRGKFDEIKEEFVINPAPIPSELSLNAGGSRWTKDLPRNLLNSFTNRSIIEERERGIHAFKEGNWSEDRGSLEWSWRWFARVVGAVPIGEDTASILRRFWPDFTVKKPPIFATIAPWSGHDRAAIGPRSCVDRDPGAMSIIVGSSRIDSTSEGVRSRLDRAAITARSHRDRGSIAKFFHNFSAPSDGDPRIVIANNRGRLMHLKPFDSMPIGRSSVCHVVRGKSSDPRHLLLLFSTCWFDDRVDSGPRDRSRSRWDPTLATRPRHLQGNTVWEHSPTRRK